MKIRPPGLPTETLPPRLRDVAPPKGKQGEEAVLVAFSKAARALASQNLDDRVDVDRVQRLRERIEAGTYEIDDLALARAMLEKELKWRP
ncbi:MAG: flagellar biosynthesis anti-sigma factor FlgM [Myxococcales bacterium]|nr:flagellar biosynthesis anti-sigma factor FlgM [Myxococcota bacterium]MDW8283345.1 flagellar biosynthesis anti-sigma factor FlgM [Myxococcales bacterium]